MTEGSRSQRKEDKTLPNSRAAPVAHFVDSNINSGPGSAAGERLNPFLIQEPSEDKMNADSLVLGGIMSPTQSPIPIPRSDNVTMEPPSSDAKSVNLQSMLPPIASKKRATATFQGEDSIEHISNKASDKRSKAGSKQMKLRDRFDKNNDN